MTREPGLSVRVKLALSYAGFLVVAGGLILGVVWVWLLRYVPDGDILTDGPFVPNRGDLLRAFTPPLLWALVFLLVFGLAGGWFLAGRMLAPLRRITEATRAAAAGSLSHRIAMPGSQDEFRELADSFDTMLARLEARVAEQQRFAANASHELRTPLAVTQTMLEVAQSDPDADLRVLVDRLQVVNTRAIDLTEALLLLSRAEREVPEREPVDLSLLAEDAAETLLPLAERAGVTLSVEGAAAPTLGSPALLRQLTANLIHNGIVHNLREGGSVRVTTTASEGSVTLAVENSGAVLDPASLPTLIEPFQRGASRIATQGSGVGLGLAIVHRIASSHRGTLALTARPAGGLLVTVTVPRSAAGDAPDGGAAQSRSGRKP